jgi:hypothetical protein
MRILLITLFFSTVGLSQLQSKSHRITVGSNLSFNIYKESENTSEKFGGIGLDLRLNFQNRYLLSNLQSGFIQTLVPELVYQTQLKQAFNLNFKKANLDQFIGPFIGIGFLHAYKKNFEMKPIGTVGMLYSRKFFQVELGFVFRESDLQSVKMNKFANGFNISAGFRIPLKKE